MKKCYFFCSTLVLLMLGLSTGIRAGEGRYGLASSAYLLLEETPPGTVLFDGAWLSEHELARVLRGSKMLAPCGGTVGGTGLDDDFDGDTVCNSADIDDDNDGILDAVESPGCFYTAQEAGTIAVVKTGLTNDDGTNVNLPFMHDGVTTSVAASNNVITAGQAVNGAVVYSIDYNTPVRLTSVSVYGSTWGTSATAMLQGSNDNNTWDDLMTAATAATANPKTFTVNNNAANSYQYYRLVKVAGTTTPAITSYEVAAVHNTAGYMPSAHAKPTCTADLDVDGSNNHQDLDSDSDGCSDSFEAGATSNEVANHQFTGTDANADGLVDSVDGATLDGSPEYAYLRYAYNQSQNLCTDTDGDGVKDLVDIDDDNDGVLDAVEQACVEADYNTNASSGISNIFSENGINSGTLYNQLAEETGLIFSPDQTFSGGITLGNACGEPALMGASWSSDIWIKSVNPMNISQAVPLHSISFKEDCAGTDEYVTYSAYDQNGNLLYTYNIAANIPQTSNQVFDVVMDPAYDVYSIKVTRVANAAVVVGVTIKDGFGVSVCDQDIDTDNDGIPNRLDLDSDGDGCPDTREAILFNNSDVVTISGNVQNGSGGTVTSTVSMENAMVPAPYGSNGFADALQSASNADQYKYTYTYLFLATLAENNACADDDGDGLPDFAADIDSDNDGIPDASESPSCFFTEAQASDITENVTSDFSWSSTNPLPNTYDNSTSTYGQVSPAINIQNKALITFELPVIDAALMDNVKLTTGTTAFGTGTWQLQGLNKSNVWEPLSPSQAMSATNTTYTFSNSLMPTVPYHLYRIVGTSSANVTNTAKLAEFTIQYKNYNASQHPVKSGCNSDTDGDGVPNFMDRDSDGDGCPDAVEAGVSGTLIAGEIYNSGSGNVMTDNAVAAGPYGSNGLADAVETTAESGIVNYTSTYNLYALSAMQNVCLDSDGDGVKDVADIDDDNDGIIDLEEENCLGSNTAKSGIVVSKPATINYTFSGSQTVANLVDGIDANTLVMYNPTGTLSNAEWFRVEFASPKLLTEWEVGHFNGQTLFSTSSTYKVQGSQDGTSWTDVSGTLTYANNQTGQSSQTSSNIASFPQNATAYKYYRYFGVSGTVGTGWATEFYFKEKNCSDLDTDMDGVPNRLDLDSDGDGCPDVREAGVSPQTDVISPASGTNNNGNSYGIADVTNSQLNPAGTDANNDGLNDSVDPDLNGLTNYPSTYAAYALAGNINLCADTDSDGINDVADLDDDNDGILDAVESPDCFYTSAEAGIISKVSTSLSNDDGVDVNLPFMQDGTTTSVAASNNVITINAAVNGAVIYSMEYPTAVRLTSITHYGTTFGTSATAMIQGSNDKATWSDLMTAPAAATATTKTFTVNNNAANSYRYYRIVKVAGTTTPAITSYEVAAVQNTTGYVPSAHPKPTCTADADGDGIVNHHDLDSDGDGCANATEGGAGFTTANLQESDLPGGNSGAGYTGAVTFGVDDNLGNTIDGNGVPTVANGGQAIGQSQVAGTPCPENEPCELVVGGTVYKDRTPDGNVNGETVNGVSNGLYISLVNAGAVQSVAAVQTDGKYRFTAVAPGSYQLVITTNASGSTAPSLTANSTYMAEGGPVVSGSATGDGSPDGIIVITLTCPGTAADTLADFGIDNSLPVTLISFTASQSPEGTLLEWRTADEKDFDRFEIEQSGDPKNGFASIGTVRGGGSPYRFTDAVARAGVSYYRLKMIDTDGSYAYSKIVTITKWNGRELYRVYPNPSDGRKVYISSLASVDSYAVYDVAGKSIPVQMTAQGGTYVFTFGKDIQPGVYVITYTTGGRSISQQFVLNY